VRQESDVSDTPLAEILANLDLVLFERLPGDVFVRAGSKQSPQWFDDLPLDPSRNARGAIVEALPFLDHFLTDAEDLWREGGGTRLRSDPFMMTDARGREVALTASAVAVLDRCFLIIESPAGFEERQHALQGAREHLLEHEAHLRRTRALLTSVDTAQSLTQQLTASGLTTEQQNLAAGIAEQLVSLSASIEALAPLQKGVSTSRR
jgi:hypothetical protein